MRPDSRHTKAPGLRPRIFASPQTTDARWLPIHRHALSSTHRWRDPARQRRRIVAIPFSSSLHFFRDLRLRNTLHEKATGLSCPKERKGYFLSNAGAFTDSERLVGYSETMLKRGFGKQHRSALCQTDSRPQNAPRN